MTSGSPRTTVSLRTPRAAAIDDVPIRPRCRLHDDDIYVIKIAAVFMISTSTISLYTAIAPRWLAVLTCCRGYFSWAAILSAGALLFFRCGCSC